MSTSTTPTEETLGSPQKPEAFWPSFTKFWSSVKLGIVLMLAIAAASIIGTIVPQGDPSGITNLKMSDGAKQFFLAIGAHNVYYSGWFMSLLALFFLNLMMSTVTTVIPRLKVGLRKPPEVSVSVQERHHDNKVYLPAQEIDSVARALKQHGYRVYQAKNGGVVAHKGRWSRFSPLVTHLGLFTILIGGLVSGLAVFKASVPLFPGETIHANQIVERLAQPRGLFARHNYNWEVRLDKFWMDYYSPDRVKQFYSNLSIVKDGKVVETKKIWVNEPFVYDGMWFYQSFWGVGGANVVVDGKPQRVELQSGEPIGLRGSLSRLTEIGKQSFIFYLPTERSDLMILRFNQGDTRPMPVAQIAPGKSATVNGSTVTFEGPALYSGLQTKSDPGIPVVYTGFVITMLGTALAFFGLRQVWVGPREDGYLMSGKANRGHAVFQQELVRIAIKLGAKANEQPNRA